MVITAVGARGNKIIFISEKHRDFFIQKVEEIPDVDVYHEALIYCLGISEDTRNHFSDIYDAKLRCINVKCLNHGWQTSGTVRIVRLAFNLYCNATPSVDLYRKTEDKVRECMAYGPEELFCCSYAPFFWQAIQIRYPEYANYDYELHKSFGGRD